MLSLSFITCWGLFFLLTSNSQSLLFEPGVLTTSHTYSSKKPDTKNGKACTWELMGKKCGNKIQTKIQVPKVILKQSIYENTTGKNNRFTC